MFIQYGTYSQASDRISIYDPEKLELLDNKTFFGRDTLIINKYDSGQIRSKGAYAIDRQSNVTNFKVGYWYHYYNNGSIESEGDFQISSFVDCGVGGYERIYYSYKTNDWIYYGKLNEIEAAGKYKLIKSPIITRCEGRANLIFMKLDKDWIFLFGYGQELDERVNSIFFSEDDSSIKLYYSKEKNELIWK